MKIAIVGGGIGGLTAALALSQSSHEITVFERSAGIRESARAAVSPPIPPPTIAIFMFKRLRLVAITQCISRRLREQPFRIGRSDSSMKITFYNY